MTIGSLVALAAILLFGFYGYRLGFVRSVGAMLGIIVGSVVATAYYSGVASFVLPFVGKNAVLAGMVGFSVVFIVAHTAVGLLFLFLDRALQFVKLLPGHTLFNKLAGLILGLLEGALLVGIALNAYTQLPLPDRVKPPVVISPVLTSMMSVSKAVLPGFRSSLEHAATVVIP